MKISSTLGRYLATLYLRNMVLMTAALWSVIYLFDTVELLRRASKQGSVSLSLVLQMGLLKLPEVGLMVFPFAILFSAIFTFWHLTRRHELVVIRSAGFSVWQFLTPIVGVALMTGILTVTTLNPVGAVFLSRFSALESLYLSHRSNQVALFDEGLWLRQTAENGYVILHAEGIRMPEWSLRRVMVTFFGPDDSFVRRIDARSASLEDGRWVFRDAFINQPGQETETVASTILPTDLTAREIEESFSSPETMSFWKLPAFIRTMESTGFDATRLKIHFQSLLAQPLLYAAMILLAAAVSLRPPRQGGTFLLVVSGVTLGLLTFFMASFLQALGASHQIPVMLSAWSPAFIMLLLGVAAMLSLEDG